jgi:hypothetical protein
VSPKRTAAAKAKEKGKANVKAIQAFKCGAQGLGVLCRSKRPG